MTSVSIVSAVAARIEFLMEDGKLPPSWRNDVVKPLISIIDFLKAAEKEMKLNKKFVAFEKESVKRSYDIDDVISGVEQRQLSSKSTGTILPGMLARSSEMLARSFERSSKSDLKSLIEGLQRLVSDWKSLTASSTGEDVPRKENDLTPTSSTSEFPSRRRIPGFRSLTSKSSSSSTSNNELRPAKVKELPPVSEENKEIFEGEAMENQVKAALLKKGLPVVCISGERGMGKTTLAKKAFYDPEIRKDFEVFAWVPVNKDFQTMKVLQDILLQLMPDKKKVIRDMDEIDLSQEIFDVQKKKRCLVVLEDLGAEEDWESIRVALMIGKSSKFLITTHSKDLAKAATSKDGVYIQMKSLTEAECVEILKEKASFDEEELQRVGKRICTLSQGSPLMAAILGNSFKYSPDETKFVQALDYYKRQGSHQGETPLALQLCYERLPDEFKPCLLYMGQFPEGQDIEVEKLYLLLAAEGIIKPKEDSGKRKTISLESVRSIYEKLALRKLVEAQEDEISKTSKQKSCRLHDQIHKFCVTKALQEGFFEIFETKSSEEESKIGEAYRLAIHLSKYRDEDAIPFGSHDMVKKIRSLLIFDTYDDSEKESTWLSELYDSKEFSHLRVLDFNGVDFTVGRLPRWMDKQVFLRYLSFRGCFLDAFPPSVSSSTFPLLETLDLRVHTDCTITIPNDIFSNMKSLRHLYFPLLYQRKGDTKLQLSGLKMLEILVNFDTGACDVNDLQYLNNLQILETISEGNHKDLEAITNYLDKEGAKLQQSSLIIRSFDCYTKDRVDIFKKVLHCQALQSLYIEGEISQFPEDVEISSNFTEMTFDGSELEQLDSTTVLRKLQNLQRLVLLNDAFVGEDILFSDALKFPNLRSLKISNLQYLEKLTFGKGAMPKLSSLVIEECDYLDEVSVPEELHNRLQYAQRKKGGHVYSVQPLIKIVSEKDQENKSTTSAGPQNA